LEQDSIAVKIAIPRSLDGLLNVHPHVNEICENLHVTLRLNRSSHHSKGQQQFAVFEDHRGNDCVKGPLSWFETIRMIWIKRESQPASVHPNPGIARRYSRAKRFEQAVDKRNRVAILVDHREINRVAVVGEVTRLGSLDYRIGMNQSPALCGIFF